jgi:N-acetylglucosamine-6-phosphate deacetylase
VLIDDEIADGDVVLDGAVIGSLEAPSGGDLLAVPGFVDLQVNGIGGVDFATAEPAGYTTADRALLATGVTSYQPTVITMPWDRYPGCLAAATAARAELGTGVIGVHAEGPFLSPRAPGVHDPGAMLEPTSDRIAQLLSSGIVSQVTIAPELAGALQAIRTLVAAGVTVALGHSDAGADLTREAIDAGASAITHLFNAMRGLSHRETGMVGVGLDDPRITPTLIVDGHHLDPSIVRLVFTLAGSRTALITDSIAATGMGEGPTPLGGAEVTVTGTRAALADGTLAGSVLTMDQAIRNTVECGIDPSAAIRSATTVPARLARLPGRATLAAGTTADVTLLDADLAVVRVYRQGKLVFSI